METIAMTILCSTQSDGKALLLKTVSKELFECGEVKQMPT